MDESQRDKFYSTPDNEDEDAEYELEPPDAEVLAKEAERGKEAIESTRMSIDIDEIYREVDREYGSEIVQRWFRDFRFRFQIKHLFIATAILAILLTLAHFQVLGRSLVILVMLTICGVYLYIQWQEMRQQQEAQRRREELYDRRRAQMEKRSIGPIEAENERLGSGSSIFPAPPRDDAMQMEPTSSEKDFRFRFSLKQLIVTMTVAALVMGMVQVMGGPDKAATMFGVLAFLGLVIHAVGVYPPPVIVLGWWLIIMLYVILSVVAAIWSLAK